MNKNSEIGYQESQNMESMNYQNSQTQNRPIVSPEEIIISHAIEMVTRLYPSVKVTDLEQIAHLYSTSIESIIEEYFQLKADNEVLAEIVKNDPRLATLILEIINGKPLRVALLNAEITSIDPIIGDIDYDQYQDALSELHQNREHAANHRRCCQRNCTCSNLEIKRFIESQQMTREEAEEFFNYLDSIIEAISNSYIDEKLLRVVWLGLFFEKEMTKSKEMAFIEGKNAQIEERKAARRVDNLASATSAAPSSKREKMGYIERVMAGEY